MISFLLLLISIYFVSIYFLYRISPKSYAADAISGGKYLSFDNGRIYYQDVGVGDSAILLLHGFNSQMSNWKKLWPELKQNPRTIRLDLPGFGKSEWHTDSYSLASQGKRVISLMDELAVSRVTLVGVSMGGSLAAWLAANYPDRVNALLLLSPSGYTGSLRYQGALNYLIKPGIINRTATWLATGNIYKAIFTQSRALQALTVTASYGQKWVRDLARITTPTLILWSSGDQRAIYQYAIEVKSRISGSELVTVPGTVGHNVVGKCTSLIAKLTTQINQGKSAQSAIEQLKNNSALDPECAGLIF